MGLSQFVNLRRYPTHTLTPQNILHPLHTPLPTSSHDKLVVHCSYREKNILSNPKLRHWTFRVFRFLTTRCKRVTVLISLLSCKSFRLRIDHFIRITTKFHHQVNQIFFFLFLMINFRNWANMN